MRKLQTIGVVKTFAVLCFILSGGFAYAATLGITPGHPDTSFTFTGSDFISYNAGTSSLVVRATPANTRFRAGEFAIPMDPFLDSNSIQQLSLTITGTVTASSATGKLTLTGEVTDFLGGGTPYSGILLTGDIVEMGSESFGTVGVMDFRMTVTGGTMSAFLTGQDIGVIVNMENSTFTGAFNADFSASPKGNLGPIDPIGTEPPVGPGTGTVGYWKNHPEAWPVEEVTAGGNTYSKTTAISLLKKAVKGDKTISMVKQLIPAMLNVANGNESSCIDATIAAANTWISQNGVLSSVKGKDPAWDIGGPLHDELDDYNNGQICAPHRGS